MLITRPWLAWSAWTARSISRMIVEMMAKGTCTGVHAEVVREQTEQEYGVHDRAGNLIRIQETARRSRPWLVDGSVRPPTSL
ncbi:hypothetical protein GCM10010191_61550 [Actinomadura vinacea]|uniref:Uncharacterized protein n=1 Tax=Actinomadura vinacea TaxID=115336 RepID=A0ABN3JRJ2_9ACTN